jgi:hypothetical protein
MKDLFQTMRSRIMSSIAISLTLGALCFSVGEGLRLTPFPIAQSGQVDPASDLTIARTSQSSVHTYGPLDIPTQAQKRNKRFAIDLSGPVSFYTNESFTCRDRQVEYQSNNVASLLLVAIPPGRAPPFTS